MMMAPHEPIAGQRRRPRVVLAAKVARAAAAGMEAAPVWEARHRGHDAGDLLQPPSALLCPRAEHRQRGAEAARIGMARRPEARPGAARLDDPADVHGPAPPARIADEAEIVA